ncbi:MAG: PD-(D/E)XK nuclease family protein [Nitrospirae bacterium]|nr:PD-(D/E)XK nuclease family protein [Magnetococcales bacterium]
MFCVRQFVSVSGSSSRFFGYSTTRQPGTSMTPSQPVQGIPALSDQLDGGDVLITINRRLSRHLTRSINAFKVSQGVGAWGSAEMIPLQAWLHKKWLEILDHGADLGPVPPRLLSGLAASQLWETIIGDHAKRGRTILWPRQTASLAQKGWEQLLQWRLPPPVDQSWGHEDTEAFIHWVATFEEHLERRGLITSAQIMGFVEGQLDRLSLPPGIILAGFDSPPPATEHFFSALQKRGVRVAHYQPESYSPSVTLRRLTDGEEEIRSAAQWAKTWLEERNNDGDTVGTVGIIHPNLSQWRSQVIRIFTEVFYPGALEFNALPEHPVFNLSLGFSLLQSPMIADALFFLTLCRDGFCTLATARRLLFSPYCAGGISEHSARAMRDVQWGEMGWERMSLKEMAVLADEGGKTPTLAKLVNDLAGWGTHGTMTSSAHPPWEWPGRFSNVLKRIGWPGEMSSSSTDFQLLDSWESLLENLTALAMVHTNMDYSRALTILQDVARSTVFQPEGGADAPIQILGSLEAGGETFAALWIMGLSDDVWPPRPEPNPFLPREFQRHHDMPRSSSIREYDFAAKITHYLLGAAPVVIVSAPERDGDLALRVSPFLRGMTQTPSPEVAQPDFSYLVLQSGHLEEISEDGPPHLPTKETFSCGTGLLKAQSLCPFQAFARYRLSAQSLPDIQTGLSPMLRGQITHRILAQLLAKDFSMKQWRALSEDRRLAAMEQACRQGIALEAGKLEKRVSKGLLELEYFRQISLLQKWMAIEERRESDFIVHEVEKSGTMHIGCLDLNYRMDRVDRLEADHRVLIDYKTGMVKIGDWFGLRPRDPQMPFYALALEEGKMVAMAYGQLSRQYKGFVGLTQKAGILPGIAGIKDYQDELDDAEIEDLTQTWQSTINQLAEGFAQGQAGIDPLKGACGQCDLGPLCRFDEDI